MSIPDFVNGSFEFIGGILLWLNVKRILKDKCYAGVSVIPTAFFASWGIWNLYYYPSLNQWCSFFGGINVVAANIVWVVLMLMYHHAKKVEAENDNA